MLAFLQAEDWKSVQRDVRRGRIRRHPHLHSLRSAAANHCLEEMVVQVGEERKEGRGELQDRKIGRRKKL